MQHQTVTERRRPIRSAMGAAIKAPIRVPMESYHVQMSRIRYWRVAYHSNNKTSSDIAEIVDTVRVPLPKATQEVGHGEEAGDLSRVITKTV